MNPADISLAWNAMDPSSIPTNSYGLFHLMIGDGMVLFGSFTGINWASGDYYIQTEIDPNGGTAYIDMG